MDNIARLALSKISDDGVRDEVSPGSYPIDVTVRIVGSLCVNEDYERAATASLPHTEILALALHLCGVQQDKAISAIRTAVSQCLTSGESAVGCIREQMPTIENEISRIKREIVGQLPKQPCKGSVKFVSTMIETVDGNPTVNEANNILRELLG